MANREQRHHSAVEDIVALVNSLLPGTLSEDLRKNFVASVKAALEGMDIATRSELEVQESVLRKARSKIEELETRVSELEGDKGTVSDDHPAT